MKSHEGQQNLIDTSVPVENTLELESTNQNLDENNVVADITSIGDLEGSVVEAKTPQKLSPDRLYELH